MNIRPTRYSFVRERIIELFNILNNRVYGIWISPESTMNLDEVRDRSQYQASEVIPDANYYTTPQLRRMRIPQILNYLSLMRSYRDLGFQDANGSVVEIYESIQEYVSLWCEVMREAPEIRNPPMGELRLLEGMAMFIFPYYKRIKPYRRNLDSRRFREDGELEAKGLTGFAALFSFYSLGTEKGDAEISFISHLDKYESSVNGDIFTQTGSSPIWGQPEGLPAIPSANYDTSWVFRG
jgi:hypothetical protein